MNRHDCTQILRTLRNLRDEFEILADTTLINDSGNFTKSIEQSQNIVPIVQELIRTFIKEAKAFELTLDE